MCCLKTYSLTKHNWGVQTEGEMGGTRGKKWENKEMYTGFWLRTLKEEDYLVHLRVDDKMI